jgi:hypothetical protein
MEKVDTQIILGRSENQAIELLKTVFDASGNYQNLNIAQRLHIIQKPEFIEGYKEIVSILNKANLELDRIAMDGIIKPKEANKTEQQQIDKLKNLVAGKVKISDKQKLCPGCQKPIPKTWTSHRKPDGCGWGEK